MTAAELWAAYTAKNPSFLGDGAVVMSAKGLKKLFDQTYQTGHDQGVINGRALEKMKPKESSFDPFKDVFGKR